MSQLTIPDSPDHAAAVEATLETTTLNLTSATSADDP